MFKFFILVEQFVYVRGSTLGVRGSMLGVRGSTLGVRGNTLGVRPPYINNTHITTADF